MKYNETIEKSLVEYIKTPAILVDKNNVPYEYRQSGSITRLKRRRFNTVSINLYAFLLDNKISKNTLSEFASGNFLNYVEMNNIYN